MQSADELFAAVPAVYRDPRIELPPALAEAELIRLMRTTAAKNRDGGDRPNFLGAGAYHAIRAECSAVSRIPVGVRDG